MGKVLRNAAKLTVGLMLIVPLIAVGFYLAALWRETSGGNPAPTTGRHIETPRGRVFVQERGTGRPLLIIGGTAAWGGFWSDVAEVLSREGYRTITIDLPPFGYSDHRAEGDYDRTTQAQRLNDIMRGMALDRPLVLGHSFGAGAVMELAAQHGNALGGMIIVCGALNLPEGDGQHGEPSAGLSTLLHASAITQPITALAMTNPLAMRPMLGTMLHRKQAADARQAEILLRPMSRPGTTAAYAAWLPNLLLPDKTARTATAAGIAGIAVRTAFIWGERDSVTPLSQGQRLTGLVRGATLDVIPDVGHIPHIEAPDSFLAKLRPRLKQLAQSM